MKKILLLIMACGAVALATRPDWRKDFIQGVQRGCHDLCEKILKISDPKQLPLTSQTIRISGDVLRDAGSIVVLKDSGLRLGANILMGKGEVARINSSRWRFLMHFLPLCRVNGMTPVTFIGEAGTYTVVRIVVGCVPGIAASLLGKLHLSTAKVYTGTFELVPGKENVISMHDVHEASFETTVIKKLCSEVELSTE